MALSDDFLDYMDDVREWEESGEFKEWLRDVAENWGMS